MKYLKLFEEEFDVDSVKMTGFRLEDFKPFQSVPMATIFQHYEYEELLAVMINRHLEEDTPFKTPLQYKYSHDEMVKKNYIVDHGDRFYTLTDFSLRELYIYQRKHLWKTASRFDL